MVQPDSYPFLSEGEFGIASRSFVEKFKDVCPVSRTCDWERLGLRRESGRDYVLITKHFGLNAIGKEKAPASAIICSLDENANTGIKDEDDLDLEALQRSNVSIAKPCAEYYILLSPSYRVPELYFFLHQSPPEGQPTLDAVYEYLVPNQLKAEVLNIGPIGGISMVNHPIFDMPAFHVHPCNTAAAMEELGGAEGISIENYLEVWVGLIGRHVGLSLPLRCP